MASNYTTNYQLNQWEAGDQVLRTDFNQDNQKIDGALKINAEAIETLEAEVITKGNCQIYTASYVGNGGCGPESPTSVTMPVAPLLAAVVEQETDGSGDGGSCGILVGGGHLITGGGTCATTWSADHKTASWHTYTGIPANQLNMLNRTYRLYILAAAE